jgi:hypothetical protein
MISALDFEGEADSVGEGEGASFFLPAADSPIGATANAARQPVAISFDVCFILG